MMQKIEDILERYDRYGRLLHYPHEWGERALRGWLVCEIFHELLNWPYECIVFGERYDVLFVNDLIRPIIYLETKRVSEKLTKEHVEKFLERISSYGSLRYALITNGSLWRRYDIITGHSEEALRLDFTRMVTPTVVGNFFEPLHAKHHIRSAR
jgi:hypothetical protein